MSIFTKYDPSTAPAEAAAVLTAAKDRYGFVPNLAAFVAESPLALETILKLSEQFDKSSLSAQEQQVVLLTVSALNDCSYCKTAHTAVGKMAEMSTETLQAILALKPLKDARMEALRSFTKTIVEEKGWADSMQVQAFLNAGFTKAQVFEVVLGVGLKTITNYSNHLVGAEPNGEFVAMAGEALVA